MLFRSEKSLESFSVDLSGNPSVAELLGTLRGVELVVETPESISGRIVSLEERPSGQDGIARPWLVLATQEGIQSISIDGIARFRFVDPKINVDFNKALALLLGARDAERRILELSLPGTGTRDCALAYVIAAPVWKMSYRLDLQGASPWFQAWAIVDNPSDQDWIDVNLSLVSGRPISFIQNLYAPLWLERPILPLSIAGTASAKTYESGFENEEYAAEAAPPAPPPSLSSRAMSAPMAMKGVDQSFGSGAPSLAQASLETAAVRAAGDQFEFSVKKPLSLERRHSAMIPLVATALEADKVSIFTQGSGSRHPMLGVRILNTTGMKLPAGPITVFDGGAYAGDALIEFLPESDKRLIVYGEDLSVTGDDSVSRTSETSGVSIVKGVMVFSKRITHTRTYTFRNASESSRNLLVEHYITSGAELVEPARYEEKTDSKYRFPLALSAGGQTRLVVKERLPAQERIILSSLSSDSFFSWASSTELPLHFREALKTAIELKAKADDTRRLLTELQARRTETGNEQARLRQNLAAVGRDSTQGQQYLKRLMDSESELDRLALSIEEARLAAQQAQGVYESYLGNLSLDR